MNPWPVSRHIVVPIPYVCNVESTLSLGSILLLVTYLLVLYLY